MPTQLGGNADNAYEHIESNQSNSPTSSMSTPNKAEISPEKDESPQDQTPVSTNSQTLPLSGNSPYSGSKGSRGSKYRRQLGPNGEPKKNFYNPPGKVMRHLAQQSYYDNFYGDQGQFYTLRQKYKTQMCKHFLEKGDCPLAQYCQYAHGPQELRQSHDPLPKNFGKTALGAVHSNYKTEPCKNWQKTGECKFGEGCSFYHNESEKRSLIDPLPNLPEGVTLPPMPEKLKTYQQKKAAGYYEKPQFEASATSISPSHFSPIQHNMFTISSLTDIVALGGFNPNKYMTPQPLYFQAQPYQYPMPSPFHFGQPAPFNHSGQPNMAQSNGNQQQKNWKKDKKDKKEKNVDKKFVKKDSPQKSAAATAVEAK